MDTVTNVLYQSGPDEEQPPTRLNAHEVLGRFSIHSFDTESGFVPEKVELNSIDAHERDDNDVKDRKICVLSKDRMRYQVLHVVGEVIKLGCQGEDAIMSD